MKNTKQTTGKNYGEKLTREQTYKIITQQIIDALESNNVPWIKPWNQPKGANARHHNAFTGRPYSRLNGLNLDIVKMVNGYTSNGWLTFHQATSKQLDENGAPKGYGGIIKKGSKGTKVFFNKMIIIEVEEENDRGELGKVEKPIWFPQLYTVFNVEQCENITLKKRELVDVLEAFTDFDPIAEAQTVLDDYKDRSGITYKEATGDSAYYVPTKDMVVLPKPKQFKSNQEFYTTAFHEFGHSTGHSSRLNRFKNETKIAHFGSKDYSYEELVAEFTACFVSQDTGIADTRENSVTYIKGWLKKLQSEPKWAVMASAQAEKASNLILGIAKE